MRRWIVLLLPALCLSCTRSSNSVPAQLQVPPGFHITVFAQAPHARMMAFSPKGVLLVTDMEDGRVFAFPDPQHNGHSDQAVAVLGDLNSPHGIVFHAGKLYVAEINRIRRYDWDESQLRASNGAVIARVPDSGEHFTRTIVFLKGRMYVSVGASCDVCVEDDKERASVLAFNDEGSNKSTFATGLRNAVGLAVNPKTGTVWTTENSRDWLGDDLPPDEINDLGTKGGNFGWPYCYGDRILDTTQIKRDDQRCRGTIPPVIPLPAHSAPLGLAFYNGTMFPPEYSGNLFVALHGSWNRSVLAGYKVIRIRLDDQGRMQGSPEDFITGWIKPGEVKDGPSTGRPVGIAFGPDGAMYVSDDSAGVIYRVTH